MNKYVRNWILLGVVLVFFQIVLGGITRLTGSGLSITKWDIVMGTLPPMNDAAWQTAFDLYKDTPQYAKINEGMSMGAFKEIFFWEYIHRLWARMMGFLFLIPFLFFVAKGAFPKWMLKRLLIIFLLAALAAAVGWIMVASGLINRPWVNAYKLAIHLSIALVLFSYLLWTYFLLGPAKTRPPVEPRTRLMAGVFTVLVFVQLFVGGIMSGSKAGLVYPSFPKMNGEWLPAILLKWENWKLEYFLQYDTNALMPTVVQLLHRGLAMLILLLGILLFLKLLKQENTSLHKGAWMLITMLIIQIGLGIFTVVGCVGNIPIGLGSSHQIGAIFLLSSILYIDYQLS